DRGIGEECRAGRGGERLAHQEIAVAMHEVKPRAGRGQATEEPHDDRVEGLLEIVVADPILEEIAEHVERLRAGRIVLEELEEALVRLRALLAEMEIRDEERAQRAVTLRRPPSSIR